MTALMPAMYPSTTIGRSEERSALVSIKAGGKAFSDSKGKASRTFSCAALTLYGSVQLKGGGALGLDDLAGSLQIGLGNYTIAHGEGEVNKKGKIQINALTSDAGKELELILHGSTRGDNVVFDSKKSKLFPLHFLSLKGTAIVTIPSRCTITTKPLVTSAPRLQQAGSQTLP